MWPDKSSTSILRVMSISTALGIVTDNVSGSL